MNIKETLKQNPLTKKMYAALKSKRDAKRLYNKIGYTGKFIDRSRHCDKLCIILAGYKPFAYPAVFGRIARFAPEDLDICVASSGLYSEELDRICQENNWSYLSTNENNVALVQNAAICQHPDAKYIFKLDEDIFITENYFQNLLRAYHHAQEGEYCPGLMAPTLNINGFGHMRILEKLGLKELYAERFEKPKYMAGPQRMVENDPAVARFFWGEGGHIPSIDQLNAQFSAQPLQELACPIRFSIGAIVYERKLWEEMGYFPVNRQTSNMGQDEVDLCSFCLITSRPVMVSENVVAGHLSFGTQNLPMKEYYESHPEIFL